MHIVHILYILSTKRLTPLSLVLTVYTIFHSPRETSTINTYTQEDIYLLHVEEHIIWITFVITRTVKYVIIYTSRNQRYSKNTNPSTSILIHIYIYVN